MENICTVTTKEMVIRRISPSVTLALRRSILRPHLSIKECRHEGDSNAETRHFGAYENAELIGVASVFKAVPPNGDQADSWRLRGMAVSEKARNSGSGKKLLAHCIDYANTQNGNIFWCYARITAIPFYEKYGFKINGVAFDFPHVGPVKLMIKPLIQ